jgi:hypothetical protein
VDVVKRLYERIEHLRELTLSDCYTMGNEGIRIVVDALAGNSIVDALDI